ncbi:MAG: hypothetical protein V3U48_03920 [Rhodospirillales bacterium]
MARLGLTMPAGDEAVNAYINHLWRENPAMVRAKSKPALGWVLEDAGKMVGFFGNLPLLYEFDGHPIIVSNASLWGVEEAYRSETPRLASAYFGQQNVDVLMVTTAIKPTGRIFERHGADRLPQPDFDQILYWVIDAPRFLRAGLKKKGHGRAASWVGGLGGGIVLNAKMRLGGRRPYAALGEMTVIKAEEIDDSFDDLWRRKLLEYPGRLLRRRDAASLKWHFASGRFAEEARFLCFRRGGRLDGYLVLIRDDAPEIGLKRLKIADLFVAGDEPQDVSALLAGAYEYGLARRCHVLEVVGLPENLREIVLSHKPFDRPMPTFPFYFKVLNPDLAGPLQAAQGWYATAYDGDTALL